MAAETILVGWQASPDRRGTFTIIENCLFTIVACTWSIQHLNVPALNESLRSTFLRKYKWALVAVFFPEFLLAHAILEFVMVWEDMRLLSQEGILALQSPLFRHFLRSTTWRSDAENSGLSRDTWSSENEFSSFSWTITHCYFKNMGGFYIRHPSDSNSPNHVLTASHIGKYWRHLRVPDVKEEDLQDKSKTDYFTKALATLQIAQLMLSLIARRIQQLAFSQLETLTLAFAICGVLTYICSWYKPQSVRRPIQVFLLPNNELPQEIQRRPLDSLWQILFNSDVFGNHRPLERIPNDNITRSKPYEIHHALWVLALLTGGFGSLHTIAWNSEFPTFPEKLLWRVATIISTVIPPAALLAIPLTQATIPRGDSRNFNFTCLDAMREYSWRTADNSQVKTAMEKLQTVCNNPRGGNHKHFRDILGDGGSEQASLGENVLDFINNNEDFRTSVSQSFITEYSQLIDILKGRSSSKRLLQTARTDSYPQRSLFSPLVNDWVIYVTIRSMPDSVYATTWTDYIPSIQ
ncbi:hypothetical protein F4808DRAFT_467184 [Astrocystis sublimbata]|nr:hypothetical protein F4808DRAFT_467184 [Astrocystis sublimbata]